MAKKNLGGSGLWVIEFRHRDPSLEGIVAYNNRSEAIDSAVDFIKGEAKADLESIAWDEGDEALEILKRIIQLVAAGSKEDAILEWLAYQNEYDPEGGIAIGPSGMVSDNPWDFPKSGK